MNIKKIYQSNFYNYNNKTADFTLVDYTENLYIGINKNGNTTAMIKSSSPAGDTYKLKTKALNIHCNCHITYYFKDAVRNEVAHVVTCLSTDFKKRMMFLELIALMIPDKAMTADEFFEVYQELSDFFMHERKMSDTELIGLYGELYAVCYLDKNNILAKAWHTKNDLKYDFSFDANKKLEIKTTVKPNRIHHFKNSQLNAKEIDVHILSIMLQRDDCGVRLYDLIMKSKDIYKGDVQRTLILDSVLNCVEEERLMRFSYNENYIKNNLRLFINKNFNFIIHNISDRLINVEYDIDFSGIEGSKIDKLHDLLEHFS